MIAKGQRIGILWCLLLLTTTGMVFLAPSRGISVEVVLLSLVGGILFAYVAIRLPELFLLGVVFAPQWKTSWPLSAIDRIVDLTLVMLAGVAACLVWQLLIRVSRLEQLGLRQLFLGQSAPIVCFLLLAASVTGSYLYTTAPAYGTAKLLRFLGIGFLLLVSPFFLISTERAWRRFARMFVAFSAITAVQLIAGLQAVARAANTDITRIGAGWLLGMAIIIALFYPLFRSESAQRTFLLCALPLFTAGLIASAARGPMVALSLVILVRLVVWLKEGKLLTAGILAMVLAVSGVGGYLVLRNTARNKYTSKISELIRLAQGDTTGGSASARLDFYRATLAAIPDAPLLGRGVGSWGVFYYGRDERAYPHNLFLEIAFEQGLLGIGALFLFFTMLGLSILWLLKETDSRFLIFPVMLSYCIVVAMFSGDLDDNRLLWLWAGMAMTVCRNVRLQRLTDTDWLPASGCLASPAYPRTSWSRS